MNDFRIARNDDETFTDEDTFVSERRDALVVAWKKDQAKVTEAIADALSNDGEDFFAGLMATLFCEVDRVEDDKTLASSAADMWAALDYQITDRFFRDAETQAQHEWDNRQTGAPE